MATEQEKMIATMTTDPATKKKWLKFEVDRLPREQYDSMVQHGWGWGPGRKQYYSRRRFAEIPEWVEVKDEGKEDYASGRADRLRQFSDVVEERAEQLADYSDRIVETRLDTGVVVHGHRAGKTSERAFKQAESAARQAVELTKYAEDLDRRAKGSERHQAYKERPEVIARRIKRLKGDITSMRNQMKHEPYGLWSARQEKNEAKITELMQAWEDSNREQERKIALVEQEIKENEQALKEAGGLITDRVEIVVGDVIHTRWQGLCRVQKINMRKGVLMSYTCEPLKNTWCRKYVVPVTDVRGKAVDKDNVNSLSLLQAQDTETIDRLSTVRVVSAQKEQRVFKVAQVQEVTIGSNNRTAFWPTPKMLAERLVDEANMPDDVEYVLEPSAGIGNIANVIRDRLMQMDEHPEMKCRELHCCELSYDFQQNLKHQGFTVVASDFLEHFPEGYRYDAIIMNPPFAVQGDSHADMTHFLHAWNMLRPGGKATALVSGSFSSRSDAKTKEVQEIIANYGYAEDIEEGAFSSAGTNVRVTLIQAIKP